MKKFFSKFITEKAFYKTLLFVGLPIALQNTINVFVQMLDTIMLGKLGDVAISASSQANQPFFIYNMIVFGLAGGALALNSQYWGQKNVEAIRNIMAIIIRIAVVIGLILFIVVQLFPEQVLRIYTNDPLVVEEGVNYIRIVSWSYVIFGFTASYLTMMRAVEVVKIAVISSVMAMLLNVFFNYCMIFGNFGFPELGVSGAAYATLIARLAEFMLTVVFVLFYDKRIKLTVKCFFKFDKALTKEVIVQSAPVLTNEVMWSLGISALAILMGQLGTAVVTANSVTSMISQLCLCIVFGVANAAGVIVGKYIGKGDTPNAIKSAYTLKWISYAVGVVVVIAIYLLKDVVINFYDISPEAKALAHELIYVVMFTALFVSPASLFIVGVLRASGDAKFALFAEIIALWVFAVPLGFLSAFVFDFPVWLVFFLMKIDEPVKVLMCGWRMRGTKWINNVTR